MQSMGWQRVRHNLTSEQLSNCTELSLDLYREDQVNCAMRSVHSFDHDKHLLSAYCVPCPGLDLGAQQ